MVIPLCNLSPGHKAQILCLADCKTMADRLFDLGFTPGSIITCVLKRPGGQIAAYLVRGAVIALRREDSRLVLAEQLPCEGSSPVLPARNLPFLQKTTERKVPS